MYLKQNRMEKNWIPWEVRDSLNIWVRQANAKSLELIVPAQGTSMMTYPSYPTFFPHTVLDWGSYDGPSPQMRAAFAAPVKFLEDLMRYRGGWVRFSGGTPGVRWDKDTFLAVGHAVGDLTCFHKVRSDSASSGRPLCSTVTN